jgi:hypothetical protein
LWILTRIFRSMLENRDEVHIRDIELPMYCIQVDPSEIEGVQRFNSEMCRP